MKNVLWFQDIKKDEINEIGVKADSLSELSEAGFPVPDGFVVSATAYKNFMKKTGLEDEIKGIIKSLKSSNSKKINEASVKIEKLILAKKIPVALSKEIIEAYKDLYLKGSSNIFVAVRSSFNQEDRATVLFSHIETTFLNVAGQDSLIEAIKNCWAAFFAPRAIYYCLNKKIDQSKLSMAVVVQKMVQAEKSGFIILSDDDLNKDKLVIKAAVGVGESVRHGHVNPDTYVVGLEDLEIQKKSIVRQSWKIVRNISGVSHVSIALSEQDAPSLTDQEITQVARLGKKIDEYFGGAVEIEWAIEGKSLYLIGIDHKTATSTTDNYMDKPEIILNGMPGSLGFVVGPISFIHKPSQVEFFDKGSILVAENLTPAFLPAIKRAAAVISDTGSRDSYVAKICRELGIPCIVGVGHATHFLTKNQIVSVDGTHGLIYKGKVDQIDHSDSYSNGQVPSSKQIEKTAPITATKVFINFQGRLEASEMAKLPSNGVGVFALTKPENVVNELSEICQAFAPRPVIVKADCADLNIFEAQIKLLKTVKERFGFTNLGLMLSGVSSIVKMEKISQILADFNLLQTEKFKIHLCVDSPANVILMEKFCQLGFDGLNINLENLTQLTLGESRANDFVFEEALEVSLAHVITTAQKHHIPVSLCTNREISPENVEFVVSRGITSLTVLPNQVVATKKLVSSLEKRIFHTNIF